MKFMLHYLGIILLGVSLCSFGKSHLVVTPSLNIQQPKRDTLALVREIDQYRQKITAQKGTLQSIQYDVFESTEGGHVQSYYQKNDTLKKEITYYGENDFKKVEIYLKEGSPVYREEVNVQYKEPLYFQPAGVLQESTKEILYFNANLQLIFWMQDSIPVSSSHYHSKERELKEYYF